MHSTSRNFKSIEDKVNEILLENQGIFFGVDHDDIYFHEYLSEIILNLKNRQEVYFLLEIADNIIQENLSRLRIFIDIKKREYCSHSKPDIFKMILADLKSKFKAEKIQFPILTAALADFYGVKVVGIDIPEKETEELHKPGTSAERISELLAERTLLHGKGMVNNIKACLNGTNKKYIILGGPMHGDVPKSLSIKSINVLESKLLEQITLNFSSLPKMKVLASSNHLKPDYTFFYDAVNIKDDQISEVKVTSKPGGSSSPAGWIPSFSVSLDIVTLSIPEASKNYFDTLNNILGDDAHGGRIVRKNAAGNSVSFPLFWLKQLGGKAVKELAGKLEVTPEQLERADIVAESTTTTESSWLPAKNSS